MASDSQLVTADPVDSTCVVMAPRQVKELPTSRQSQGVNLAARIIPPEVKLDSLPSGSAGAARSRWGFRLLAR